MLSAIRLCRGVEPVMANNSPAMYSLRYSARSSARRYSSTVSGPECDAGLVIRRAYARRSRRRNRFVSQPRVRVAVADELGVVRAGRRSANEISVHERRHAVVCVRTAVIEFDLERFGCAI